MINLKYWKVKIILYYPSRPNEITGFLQVNKKVNKLESEKKVG